VQDGVLNVTGVTTGSTINVTITNDDNRLTKEEMKQLVANSERYRLDDIEQRNRATARNELEYYCLDVQKLVKNIQHPEKKALVEKCEQAIKWLALGPLSSVEEMTEKKQEIRRLCNSVLPAE